MWKKSSLKPQKIVENSKSSHDTLKKDLNENIAQIKEDLGNCSDLIVRIIKHIDNPFSLAVVHIYGISNIQEINEHILEPLLSFKSNLASEQLKDKLEQTITISNIKVKNTFSDILTAILSGNTVILINGDTSALILDTKEFQSRGITEPTTQTVIRGPKDGFTENLRTNTSLIRARVQSPNLRLESMIIGEVTQTAVEIMYINGIAKEE